MAAIEFITQFDAEPEFWQFLNGLNYEDIITELIQNDLDADATHTSIKFEPGGFSCEGNGKPIDQDGWKRLPFVRGAGDKAPRKRFRIGVKNHGLKTCFTLGDEINLFSAGMHFQQTLYRDGPDSPPHPGTYKQPVPDPGAPLMGCRVQVPYRTKILVTTVGEPLEFTSPGRDTLEQLFRQSCADIPGRFIGAIRPGTRERYTIEFSHYGLGSVTYQFRCTPRRKPRRGSLFSRTCTAGGTFPNLPVALRERVFDLVIQRPMGSGHEIPGFYSAPKGFHIEIAWPVNAKGAPLRTEGRRRYPIAYAGSEPDALTGLSVHYSAPFISDQERHGATDTPFNTYVTKACDGALIQLLRDSLLQEYGPKALELLVAKEGLSSDRLRWMTRALMQERLVPLAHKTRSKLLLGPCSATDGKIREIVVSSFTWAPAKVVPLLQALCPKECDQIDPRVPTEIIALLADSKFEGWSDTHVTFDEEDVVKRMQPGHEEAYFKWASELDWRTSLGDTAFSRRCLDVVATICEKKAHLATERIAELRQQIYLPDTRGLARPLDELYLGNDMPPELAALGTPPILHKRIISHPLMRRRAWKLKTYSLAAFLESADLNAHSDPTRQTFFKWLTKNLAQIPKQYNSRIAAWRIWPDLAGALHSLAELCQPRDAKVASILSGIINQPSAETARFLAPRRNNASALAVRTKPTSQELDLFYTAQLQRLPQDRALTDEEVTWFRQMEECLSLLARNAETSAWVAALPLMGLARDGRLRPVSILHQEASAVADVALLDCDLLDRAESPLDRIHPPRRQPSVEALIRALTEDATRVAALIPRLKSLEAALAAEGRTDRPAENIACIPYDGRLLPPAALALKGNRGSYWGQWKVNLSGKVSADEQQIYRRAGVTGSEPDSETSLAFFRWLNEQPETVTRNHIEEIVRHVASDKSVRTWWESYPEIPCVPAEFNGSLRLISRKLIGRQGNRVFVPDFEELVEVIRADAGNRHVLLAIVSHPNVAEPVAEHLRSAGIPSLRASAVPLSVTGLSSGSPPADLNGVFRGLQSSRLKDLRKRLSALDFPMEHMREDWRSRLERVKELMIAERVSAAFRIGGRTYRIDVHSGFDEASGIIWLRRDMDLNDALFEALVQRVFRQGVPRYAASVLQKAVRWEYRETAGPLLESTTPSPANEEDTDDRDHDQEPWEAQQTHRPAVPEPGRNVPHPGPIPPKLQVGGLPKTRRRFGQQNAKQALNNLELTQIEDLKQNQYAWHCQVCLAERTPRELAPEGSYVAVAENRRLIIEAEHADQKHAGGARNAGNLILLCHFHHHQLGNALSRDLLTDALRNATATKQIEFRSGTGKKAPRVLIEGHVVAVCPPALGMVVNIFFTSSHAEYWLNVAPPENPVS